MCGCACRCYVCAAQAAVLQTYTRERLIELVKSWGGSVSKGAKKQDLVAEAMRVIKPADCGCSDTGTDDDSMVEAHKWAHKAVTFAYNSALAGTLPSAAALWTEGRITMGTSFSGIGTPEWALGYLKAAGEMIPPADPLPGFQLLFSLDKEPACRKAHHGCSAAWCMLHMGGSKSDKGCVSHNDAKCTPLCILRHNHRCWRGYAPTTTLTSTPTS